MSCFEGSDHEGHDVQFLAVPTSAFSSFSTHLHCSPAVASQVDAGGSCDCGDTEAWSLEGCCSKHRPDEAASDGEPALDLPPLMEESARRCLQVSLIVAHMSIYGNNH